MNEELSTYFQHLFKARTALEWTLTDDAFVSTSILEDVMPVLQEQSAQKASICAASVDAMPLILSGTMANKPNLDVFVASTP